MLSLRRVLQGGRWFSFDAGSEAIQAMPELIDGLPPLVGDPSSIVLHCRETIQQVMKRPVQGPDPLMVPLYQLVVQGLLVSRGAAVIPLLEAWRQARLRVLARPVEVRAQEAAWYSARLSAAVRTVVPLPSLARAIVEEQYGLCHSDAELEGEGEERAHRRALILTRLAARLRPPQPVAAELLFWPRATPVELGVLAVGLGGLRVAGLRHELDRGWQQLAAMLPEAVFLDQGIVGLVCHLRVAEMMDLPIADVLGESVLVGAAWGRIQGGVDGSGGRLSGDAIHRAIQACLLGQPGGISVLDNAAAPLHRAMVATGAQRAGRQRWLIAGRVWKLDQQENGISRFHLPAPEDVAEEPAEDPAADGAEDLTAARTSAPSAPRPAAARPAPPDPPVARPAAPAPPAAARPAPAAVAPAAVAPAPVAAAAPDRAAPTRLETPGEERAAMQIARRTDPGLEVSLPSLPWLNSQRSPQPQAIPMTERLWARPAPGGLPIAARQDPGPEPTLEPEPTPPDLQPGPPLPPDPDIRALLQQVSEMTLDRDEPTFDVEVEEDEDAEVSTGFTGIRLQQESGLSREEPLPAPRDEPPPEPLPVLDPTGGFAMLEDSTGSTAAIWEEEDAIGSFRIAPPEVVERSGRYPGAPLRSGFVMEATDDTRSRARRAAAADESDEAEGVLVDPTRSGNPTRSRTAPPAPPAPPVRPPGGRKRPPPPDFRFMLAGYVCARDGDQFSFGRVYGRKLVDHHAVQAGSPLDAYTSFLQQKVEEGFVPQAERVTALPMGADPLEERLLLAAWGRLAT